MPDDGLQSTVVIKTLCCKNIHRNIGTDQSEMTVYRFNHSGDDMVMNGRSYDWMQYDICGTVCGTYTVKINNAGGQSCRSIGKNITAVEDIDPLAAGQSVDGFVNLPDSGNTRMPNICVRDPLSGVTT